MLPNKKTLSVPYHLQDYVKNKLDRLMKSGHLERLETFKEDCLVCTVVITAKNGLGQVCIGRPQIERQLR